MSIILPAGPNLNHSFICLVPVPVLVPFAGSVCGFRIPDSLLFHTPSHSPTKCKQVLGAYECECFEPRTCGSQKCMNRFLILLVFTLPHLFS